MKHKLAAPALAIVLAFVLATDTAWARGGGRGSHSGGRHSGGGAHAGGGHHAGGGGHHAAGRHIGSVPSRNRFFVRPPVHVGAFFAVPAFAYFPTLLPAVVVPYAAVDYIEKGPERPAPESYWYYCPEGQLYYPYIEQCPGGWQLVVPGPVP